MYCEYIQQRGKDSHREQYLCNTRKHICCPAHNLCEYGGQEHVPRGEEHREGEVEGVQNALIKEDHRTGEEYPETDIHPCGKRHINI